MRVVEIVPHDPGWRDQFQVERRLLLTALPGALSVDHIGSTSVPGLAAKPIIDIVVVVPSVAEVAADFSALEQLGYSHRPLAFADDIDHLYFVRDTAGRRTHHLHVFDAASPWPQHDRVFRDYLAGHPDAARRYEAAKRRAADAHPDSKARYGQAKEAVMQQLTTEAAAWASAESPAAAD